MSAPILITGGAGFIGTNLLLFLQASYPQTRLISFDIAEPLFPVEDVTYIHGDVRSLPHLRKVARGAEKIFHLAAELGTHETFINPDTTNEVNIGGTVTVLEAAREFSSAVFVASKPNVWLNPYSISKAAAEQYALLYAREYGVKVTVGRWFSVYGPYQYIRKYQKAVPTFIYRALTNQDIPVYGDGTQKADFLHVKDAVRAADFILQKEQFGTVVEIGTGKGVSPNDLAALIVKLTNSSSRITHQPMRQGETSHSEIIADTETAASLGFAPKVDLDQGLIQTIGWYQDMLPHLMEKPHA